jgi:hypothetical protein
MRLPFHSIGARPAPITHREAHIGLKNAALAKPSKKSSFHSLAPTTLPAT